MALFMLCDVVQGGQMQGTKDCIWPEWGSEPTGQSRIESGEGRLEAVCPCRELSLPMGKDGLRRDSINIDHGAKL